MKYTNNYDLPKSIVNAIVNDDYSSGKSNYSVTTLLSPPRIRLLKMKHNEELTEDVSDRIWTLLGQSVHTILERANEDKEDMITEKRYFAQLDGVTISGQTDTFSLGDKTLQDYKVTSVWTIIFSQEGKPEWEQQLNCYAWLHKKNTGEDVKKLEIIAIARDWNKREKQRRSGDYPETAISVLEQNLWDYDEQEKFIRERISVHEEAEKDFIFKNKLPMCSDQDRWKKDDTFRCMKKGRKTAVRVFKSKEEADEYIASSKEQLYIEQQKGEATRCSGNYCGVANFCEQYQTECV